MSYKVAEIPQDVKDIIKQKATELIATYTGKVRFKDGAEFGYSLAQQEIAEAKKEISRLNNLLNTYMPTNMND